MTLFQRLMFRRLCNEQPVEGGPAPAPSEPTPAAAGSDADPAQPAGDKKQPDAEGVKPAEPEKAEGEKDKQTDEKEKNPDGAPEKYEFKATEGQELDETALKEFEPIARELNLTNEQAQKFVDVYASKILPQLQQQQIEKWTQQTEQWAVDARADKEIGGDNMTANIGLAQKALDQFGSHEFKEYLNNTGLGNHPEIIRAFMKVGRAMSEDSVVMTNNSGQRSAAEVLYGK